jgi:uncharacterized ParB-like nuclease family protein
MPKRIQIAKLSLGRRREPLDHGWIKELRARLRRGEKLRPIDVSTEYDGTLRVQDGYHRYHAHRKEGRKSILANVIVVLG